MIVGHTMLGPHFRNRLFLDGCMLAVVCCTFYQSTRETDNIAPSRLVRLLMQDGESIVIHLSFILALLTHLEGFLFYLVRNPEIVSDVNSNHYAGSFVQCSILYRMLVRGFVLGASFIFHSRICQTGRFIAR